MKGYEKHKLRFPILGKKENKMLQISDILYRQFTYETVTHFTEGPQNETPQIKQ